MSNEFDAGRLESAFPSTFKSLDPDPHQIHRWGMTLRDYFAAKAMREVPWLDGQWHEAANACYKMADAMLKARGQ